MVNRMEPELKAGFKLFFLLFSTFCVGISIGLMFSDFVPNINYFMTFFFFLGLLILVATVSIHVRSKILNNRLENP